MRRTRHDHPFVIEVGAILREPGARREITVAAVVPDLAVSGSRVLEGSAVGFDGVLESVHGSVLVTGTVRATWQGACRRCLEPATGEICALVRELCVEGAEEDPDEMTYALDDEELDLEPIVHDACILELPLAPLCREDCLGLCPECGANRNLEPCSCGDEPDPRWAPLVLLGGGGSVPSPGRSGRRPAETDTGRDASPRRRPRG